MVNPDSSGHWRGLKGALTFQPKVQPFSLRSASLPPFSKWWWRKCLRFRRQNHHRFQLAPSGTMGLGGLTVKSQTAAANSDWPKWPWSTLTKSRVSRPRPRRPTRPSPRRYQVIRVGYHELKSQETFVAMHMNLNLAQLTADFLAIFH